MNQLNELSNRHRTISNNNMCQHRALPGLNFIGLLLVVFGFIVWMSAPVKTARADLAVLSDSALRDTAEPGGGLQTRKAWQSLINPTLAAETPNLSPLFYDAENDELTTVETKSPDQLRERNAWVAREAAPRKPWNWNWNWNWNLLGSSSRIFLWVTGIFLATVFVGFIVYLLSNSDFGRGYQRARQSDKAPVDISAQISKLPFQMEAPTEGLLDLCKAARDRGDFNQATIYLFGHLLISLDEAQLIRLRKGKTNRMYARELRQHSHLRSIYDQVTLTFERVFFGRHDIGQQVFERSWQQFSEFERAVAEAQATSRNAQPKNRSLPAAGGTA